MGDGRGADERTGAGLPLNVPCGGATAAVSSFVINFRPPSVRGGGTLFSHRNRCWPRRATSWPLLLPLRPYRRETFLLCLFVVSLVFYFYFYHFYYSISSDIFVRIVPREKKKNYETKSRQNPRFPNDSLMPF